MNKTDTLDLVIKGQLFDNEKLAEYTDYLRKKYVLNNKILLIQSPQFLFDSFNVEVVKNRGYYAYPPTGLQCIAKALSGRGLEIKIVDLNYLLLKEVIRNEIFDYRNWVELLDEYLERIDPSVIGVSSINVYTDVFKLGYPLTRILEYLCHKNKYITIAGGAIATNEYANYLAKSLCHFVIEGEGENKINILFDYLFYGGTERVSLKGTYFKLDDKVEETQGNLDRVELKGNLIETYDLFPIEDYHNVGSLNPYSRMAGPDRPFSVFQLIRGCRANCKFCGVSSFMGKGVRHFPVQDVLDEITYLVKIKGIRHFDVLDDDFLIYKDYISELLTGLVKLRQAYEITWSSNNGLIAASITEELMTLMRDSGCVGFRIGIESGSSEMLKKMRKPANLDLLRQASKIMNRFPEVFTGGNYIIGLLGEETFKEMLTTFRFCCELDLAWASIAIFQFTSTANAFDEKLKSDGRTTTDFVPSKSDSNREILLAKDIVSGPDVFDLPENKVPSYEQIKQIWFTFNLVINYINNKNLKKSGRPEKFRAWVDAVRISYPKNPYMTLFSSLASVLVEDKDSAENTLKTTKAILNDSQYWCHRFSQFDLENIVKNFPDDAQGVYEALEYLQKRYFKWVK